MSHQRTEDNTARAKLSADEATELAAQVASLSRSGLPLESGLRALADEMPRGRLTPMLCEMAQRLQRGESLESAIEAMGPRIPAPMRGLILAGTRSGRPAEVLEEFVDVHRSQEELRRRVWQAVGYPFLLLVALSSMAILADRVIMPDWAEIYEWAGVDDFFAAKLPWITRALIDYSGTIALSLSASTAALIAVVVLLTHPIPRLAALHRPLHAVPVIGPLWRFGRLMQCCRLIGLLLQLKIPLPEAFRLAAGAVRDPHLAKGCRDAAADMEAGRPLVEALASQRRFPATMVPLIEWGERTNALPEAFEANAKMFEERTETEVNLLATLLLPITFLIISVGVFFYIAALFTPMMTLIRGLSWYRRQTEPLAPIEMIAGMVGALTMIALGILVLKVVHGIDLRRNSSRGSWMLGATHIFGCTLIGIGVVAGWCFPAGWLGVAAGLVTLIVVIELVVRRRRARQHALLGVLASAAERSIPLVSAVDAFARDERAGAFRCRANRLARLLGEGVPLPFAMKRSGTLFPLEVKPLLHVGEESGGMVTALRHAASRDDSCRQMLTQATNKLAYLGLLILFATYILMFPVPKITYSFRMIFEDFEAELPLMTYVLTGLTSLLSDWLLVISPVIGVAVGYGILRYYGWIHWDPPGIRRLVRRLDSAAILDALALTTEQRKPLHATVGTLADTYHKSSIRKQLDKVLSDMNRGADWCDALARRGLLTRSGKVVLQAAQRAGNLPWALRETADGSRRRVALRLQAWVQSAVPSTILPLGAIVAFVSVALLLPLVSLIMGLT